MADGSLPVRSKDPLGRGRPSVYTQELADRICEGLRDGKTLRAVCRQDGMPDEKSVRTWAADPTHPFAPQYAQAREIGYQVMADELLEISDDSKNDAIVDEEGNERPNTEFVARSRLRVDTRKWLLSKALPKIYGDRVETRVVGADGGAVEVKDIGADARRVAFMLGRAVGRQSVKSDAKS